MLLIIVGALIFAMGCFVGAALRVPVVGPVGPAGEPGIQGPMGGYCCKCHKEEDI